MAVIKDFIESNDNLYIIIDAIKTRNTIEPLRDVKWKGMLRDIPSCFYDCEVIQAGYLLGANCNCLTILDES